MTRQRLLSFLILAGSVSLAAGEAAQVTLLRVPNGGLQPQVQVDSQGTVHLIYYKGDARAGDIFYVQSTDGGKTFSDAIRVNRHPSSAIAAGNIRGAHLALGEGGRVHVAWNGSGKSEPKGADGKPGMLYTRLDDTGTAFEPQRNLRLKSTGLDGGGDLAADKNGNVYVAWHALPNGGEPGEGNRRVFVARSRDSGKTFAPETPAYDKPTGACGCCGLNGYSDSQGNFYIMYRTAWDMVNRHMFLLTSDGPGKQFRASKVHEWSIGQCVMSSTSFAEGPGGTLTAWETKGQVYFAKINPKTGQTSAPIAARGDTGKRKHPVIAINAKGEILLAWTEGMGWNRGGDVAWQVFGPDGRPGHERGRERGVPTWSLVAAFALPDGGFTILY